MIMITITIIVIVIIVIVAVVFVIVIIDYRQDKFAMPVSLLKAELAVCLAVLRGEDSINMVQEVTSDEIKLAIKQCIQVRMRNKAARGSVDSSAASQADATKKAVGSNYDDLGDKGDGNSGYSSAALACDSTEKAVDEDSSGDKRDDIGDHDDDNPHGKQEETDFDNQGGRPDMQIFREETVR